MDEVSTGVVVGVDSGGTFTDAVVLTADGTLTFDKAPTTTGDLSQGTMDALGNVVESISADLAELLGSVTRFAHGTTVATNALIERTGCRVGLLTTRGFEDTTVLMRDGLGKSMGVPYHAAMDYLHTERPDPLPPKGRIRAVTERVDDAGEVLTPLDEDDARHAIDDLLELDIDAVAVNFLWSFRNPDHEERVEALVEESAPDVFVTRSSSVAPVLGEYERSMTTVVNAYLGPIMDRYIDRLDGALRGAGLERPVQLMQSTGGLVPAREARRAAVSMIGSGPVGGLVAARLLGRFAGTDDIIATDVGGTSFDVGVIRDGEFAVDRTPFIDQGIPVHVPAVEIGTIGAGGGSVVWTRGNRLRVGPDSAGAQPGPVCYGRGGTEPTVTDALVILGYLNPANFFSGRMTLDVGDARDALGRVGNELGLSVEEVATGTYEVATSKMADLLRKETVEKGNDPREFTLYSYGGAGPAFAATYGADLGVEEVVVPRAASVFSALGIAFADTQRTYSQTSTMSLDEADQEDLRAVFETLEQRAIDDIEETNDSVEEFAFSHAVDLRYEGQMNELAVETARSPSVEELRETFDRTYDRRYGRGASLETATVEAITFRLRSIKAGTELPIQEAELGDADPADARRESRTMRFPDEGETDGAVYDGPALDPGNTVSGPAIIEQPRTTIVVPPGFQARVNGLKNVHITWRHHE